MSGAVVTSCIGVGSAGTGVIGAVVASCIGVGSAGTGLY